MKKTIKHTLCILMILLSLVLSSSFLTEKYEADGEVIGYNPMPPQSAESRARALRKIALSQEYCRLKNSGQYTEALSVLKKAWPETKTTIKEIKNSSEANSLPISVPTLGVHSTVAYQQRAVNVQQYPQEKNVYCAPASVRSIISSQSSTPPSQDLLASSTYLNTHPIQGTSFDANTLPRTLNTFMRTNGGYELSWGGNFSVQTLKNTITTSIDAGFPILANGVSYPEGSGNVHLSWYPRYNTIYHYVCVYGYSDYGATTYVCDPAANSPALTGFEAVIPMYGYSTDLFYQFILSRGIVF